MSNTQFRQVIVTPDGKQHESMAEAKAWIRRPMIMTALTAICGGNGKLADWLLNNQETVEMAFETGTIRRVSKNERKQLAAALDHLATLADPKLAFLKEHKAAVIDSFRWPTVTRMGGRVPSRSLVSTLSRA